MKKLITSILIVLILFNFIFCNRAWAAEATINYWQNGINADEVKDVTSSSDIVDGLINAGEAVVDGGSTVLSMTWNVMGAIFGAIMGILAFVINIFPMVLRLCMDIICEKNFTIENAVFGQIGLFDFNYFNFSSEYKIGTGSHVSVITTNSLLTPLKENVAKYFVILRLLAMVISLLILIYVGIRMALSTVAEDKAKYKKMLLAWFESIILLYAMQYIMVFIFSIGKTFLNILYNLKVTLNATSFEEMVIDNIYSKMVICSGWKYVQYSVVFWFLVYIQTKFFLSYIRRMIAIGFLITISPLITVTYPIDKIGDGKAQAFSVWFNEFCVNIFIQPIHALIYLVFIYTAGEIAKYSIFIAAIFLLSLTKVEKIVLHLFNLRNVVSLRPVDDERKKGK